MAEHAKPDMTNIWASAGATLAPSLSKTQTGWTAEIPPHQWENWVQNRQDVALGYLFQHGVPLWDATTEYFANRSITLHGGNLYVALSNNINANPTSSPSDWRLVVTTATSTVNGTVTLASPTEAILGADPFKVITPNTLAQVTATDARRGLVELATPQETLTGADSLRVVTPAGLQYVITNQPAASESARGIVELATPTEVNNGVDSLRVVTPAGLTQRYATNTRSGLVFLANNTESQLMIDSDKAITPGTLNIAFKGINQSLLLSGFQRLPGGLIIQWTGGTIPAGAGGTSFSWPMAWPNLMLTAATSDTGETGYSYGIRPDSQSTFSVWRTSTNVSQVATFRVIAIGT